MDLNNILLLAKEHGVVVRGGFLATSDDKVPGITSLLPSKALVLFGQAGPSLWRVFSGSAEFRDGNPNPMDRWSERIGNCMANELDGLALFPFGGPPHHPFQQWASRTDSLNASRLGLSIHPQFGLWHAYRFAIALPKELEGLAAVESISSACDSCVSQPCLTSCPVDAFSDNGYDVQTCLNYLKTNLAAACHSNGCQARDACPEGREFRYGDKQIRFHMRHFYHSLLP